MAREIKFRAWNNERMTCKPIVGDGTNGREAAEVWLNDALSLSDEVLMQYIGLKDKNGKEIYEGDVVRCKDYGEEPIGVIVYRGDGFVIDWKSETDFNNSISVRLDTTEVIGNIYQFDSVD